MSSQRNRQQNQSGGRIVRMVRPVALVLLSLIACGGGSISGQDAGIDAQIMRPNKTSGKKPPFDFGDWSGLTEISNEVKFRKGDKTEVGGDKDGGLISDSGSGQ